LFVFSATNLTGYDVPESDLHHDGLERDHVCHRARLHDVWVTTLHRKRHGWQYNEPRCQTLLRSRGQPRVQHEPHRSPALGLPLESMDIRGRLFLPGLGIPGHGCHLIAHLHLQV